ncbi:iron-sulfur cluster biosynthesis family protein [Bacillus sp. JJ1562]|uniref:iron-sulfur cluster biosynthesis family protein n=1 Tax=Bacillus sp. JJ1562 TaxID=3122960 RepID=UPI003002CA74
MAGVPTLLFVSSKDETEDFLLETSYRPVIMEKSQMINFDDDLTIDYSNSVNSFQLKSPQQFINGRMSFIM